MDETSDLDYAALSTGALGGPDQLPGLIESLSREWSAAYRARTPTANLYEFGPEPWTFLFDFSTEIGAPQWDRTVAAWGLSVPGRRPRDQSYQRGYPPPYGRADRPLDKGHMVPHQLGGEFGQNIFPQDRELNRGWSEQGRRYRALERAAAATPGTFFFCRLGYLDETDFPAWVELGVLRADGLRVERFRNRFD
jgi:hypothetical protein